MSVCYKPCRNDAAFGKDCAEGLLFDYRQIIYSGKQADIRKGPISALTKNASSDCSAEAFISYLF